MDTKVALCTGEYESPSFAFQLKIFKQKVGKDKLEEMMSNFSHDKHLLNMFSYLWSQSDVHYYMSPLIGDGGKNRQKSLNVRQLGDIYLKVGEKEKAMENLNISLMLSPHPRVPWPNEELCDIHRQPLSDSASERIRKRGSKGPLKISSCRLCIHAMTYSEDDEFYDCARGCKYLGLRPLHEILNEKDNSEQPEKTTPKSEKSEKTTPKSEKSEKTTPKSMPKNGKKGESKNSTATAKVEEPQALDISDKLEHSASPLKEIKKKVKKDIPEVRRSVEHHGDQWELETGNSENEQKELHNYGKEINDELETINKELDMISIRGGFSEAKDLKNEKGACLSNPLKRLRSPNSALRIAEDYIPPDREICVEDIQNARVVIDSMKESCLRSKKKLEKGMDISHGLRDTTESKGGTVEKSIDSNSENDKCKDAPEVLKDKTESSAQEFGDTLANAAAKNDKYEVTQDVCENKMECKDQKVSATLDAAASENDRYNNAPNVKADKTECEGQEGGVMSAATASENDKCKDTQDAVEYKIECKAQELGDTSDAAVSKMKKSEDTQDVSECKTEFEAHEGSDTLSETEVDVKVKAEGIDSSDRKEAGEYVKRELMLQVKQNLSDNSEMSEFDANQFKESFKLKQSSGFGGARPKESKRLGYEEDKQTDTGGEYESSNCGKVIDNQVHCPYGNGMNKTEFAVEERASSTDEVKASQGDPNGNEGKSVVTDMREQLDYSSSTGESDLLDILEGELIPCHISNSVCAYPDYLSGLEMRAILLHRFKEYDRCLGTLDLIFKYDIPDVYLKPLVELKEKCLLEINRNPKKKSKETMFAYGTSVTPKLSEANSTYPALSAAVECKSSSNRGKFLIASRDIRPGEILAVEEPYCFIVNRGELAKFCAKCLQRCIDPIPCPECCVVIFCSEKCVMRDWKHPHWPLCNVVLPSLVSMKMDSIVMLAAHVLTQISYLKLREMLDELCQEEDLPDNLRGLNKDGLYTSAEYRTVYHLLTNEEARSDEQRFDVANEAFVLTKLLRECRRYFVDKDMRPFTPTLEDLAIAGTTAMRHLMSLRCSAVALSELRIVTSDPEDSWTSCIGCGVYPSISLANHSCTPNSALCNSGKTVAMFSTRTIPKNSPVTISYVTQFRLTSTDIRRSILLENYFISCACDACTKDWFPDFEEIFELKCVKCSKAIDLKKGLCSTCQIYYREGKDFKDAPYNFYYVKDKLYQAASTCKKARQKILSKISCSAKDVSNVTNAIELMEKYVKEPCSMLLDAQETLRLSFLREGSWVIVKERTKGWVMGPAFLINSSLTGKDDVFKDDAEPPKFGPAAPAPGPNTTPKRRKRPAKQSQDAEASMSCPPAPYVPMWNPPPKIELPSGTLPPK